MPTLSSPIKTWTSGNQTYVLHSIVLNPSTVIDRENTVISCLLNPLLISLLPDCLLLKNRCKISVIAFYQHLLKASGCSQLETSRLENLSQSNIRRSSFPLHLSQIGLQLPDRRRAELMSIANSRTSEECPSPVLVEGIVRTNSLALQLNFPKSMANDGLDAKLYGGVYPLLNRCNHRYRFFFALIS